MNPSKPGLPWGCLTMVFIFGFACWFTNPAPETHRARLREKLTRALDEQIEQEGFLGGTLLWLVKDDTVDAVLQRVKYENYLLCSRTVIDGEQATFGIAGQVFIKTAP